MGKKSRSKREQKMVEHSFGLAYGEWLNMFESLEDIMTGRTKPEDVAPPCFDPRFEFFDLDVDPDPDELVLDTPRGRMLSSCVRIWSKYAPTMRNAFKFKVDAAQLHQGLVDTFSKKDEVEITTYLPFGSIYLQVEQDTGEQVLFLCERQPAKKDYPEMGLREGETFIAVTPAAYFAWDDVPESPFLAVQPVELHIPEGATFKCTKHRDTIDDGDGVLDVNDAFPHDDLMTLHLNGTTYRCEWEQTEGFGSLFAAADGANLKLWNEHRVGFQAGHIFFTFLLLLGHEKSKQTNRGVVKAGHVVRRKPKHRKRHPVYEYSVLELDLGDEEPSVNTYIPRESTKKRQHMVRGFWRKYKKPLKSGPHAGKTRVFVKEHWRGDKALGVVRKDYIFNNGKKSEVQNGG